MQFDPQKTIFLIDGSSFLYRAYYSLQPLHTSTGQPVQAVYGFIRMLKKLVDSFSMEYAVVAWDSKGPTIRHTLYSDYKATRQAPPNDLFIQKDYIQEFIELIKLPSIAKEGVEADDLLYSLAISFKAEDHTVVLVTSDKDMYQLLDDKVVMYDAMKNEFITKESFIAKKGYPVERVPLFYALMGDSSDNIPGVAGIGKVGATEIVQQFDSLDSLYGHLEQLKPRLKRALLAHKENAYLSLKLFTLHYYDLKIKKSDCSFSVSQFQNAVPLYKKLEFSSLVKQFDSIDGLTQHVNKISASGQQLLFPSVNESDTLIRYWKEKNIRSITTEKDLTLLCKRIEQHKMCAIDTETDSKHPLESTLAGISFSIDGDHAYYIPCNHVTNEQQLSQAQVFFYIKPILENPAIVKYMHNAKFDLLVLYGQGIEVAGLVADTMIQARLLNPEWQKVGLKNLSQMYCNEQMLTFSQIVTEKKYTSFAHVPLQNATIYAAADARQTAKISFLLAEQLTRETDLALYYRAIEHPLITVLYEMEKEGVFFNKTMLDGIGIQIKNALENLEIEIKKYTIQPINLNSPRQVEQFLFKELGLPSQKKSNKGTAYSTDQSVLQILAPLHPAPKLLLQHRELSKLKNTYVDALPTYINKKTGKIHTTFSQTIVATGRLSSSEPNLQNIPVTGLGLEIRAACQPKEDHLFISADYSQIELRVLAYLTQDPVLLDAFAQNKDIHTQTAAGIFSIPEIKITPEQRQIGKKINFSVLYGQEAYSLSKELQISHAQAKEYIENYFAQYPQVKKWMLTVVEKAKETGYVQSFWGRKRFIANINQKNHSLAKEAQRIAVNTVVQGTAADIVKIGMIRLYNQLKEKFPTTHMLLQIHDEILITTPAKMYNDVMKLAIACLETVAPDWNVSFKVSTRLGTNWKEVSK
ncbi:MAG TPA: DNA polymerase I [Patescibacteria group bacterium]|jgi:DNA polymerase-1|nr:DNA polymerase I [Patescibacteria group bacterium]